MRTSWLAVLISAAVCFACSDSSAPAPSLSGTYQLIAVNGQSMPVAFGDDTALASIRWLSGKVTTLPKNRFIRQLIQQLVENGEVQQTDTVLFSDSLSFYRIHGSTVQFYDVLRPPAGGLDTAAAFSGTLNEDASVLTITEDNAVAGAGAQLRFDR